MPSGLKVESETTISINPDFEENEPGQLTDRERVILQLRFGLPRDDGKVEKPKTLEEVSRSIGRTRERVRQIQNQALETLRNALEEQKTIEESNRENSEEDDDY